MCRIIVRRERKEAICLQLFLDRQHPVGPTGTFITPGQHHNRKVCNSRKQHCRRDFIGILSLWFAPNRLWTQSIAAWLLQGGISNHSRRKSNQYERNNFLKTLIITEQLLFVIKRSTAKQSERIVTFPVLISGADPKRNLHLQRLI